MTNSDPSIPAPSPENDVETETPAEAFPPFTERLPEAEIWRRARQDYLGGDSAPVVAERYGLSVRSVQRHAARHGWRRVDVRPELEIEGPTPIWPPNRARLLRENPDIAEAQAERDGESVKLLLFPHVDDLREFAFKRACEAAALGQPSQAAAWMRLQRLVEQCRPIDDPESKHFAPAVHLRAAVVRAMGADMPDLRQPDAK